MRQPFQRLRQILELGSHAVCCPWSVSFESTLTAVSLMFRLKSIDHPCPVLKLFRLHHISLFSWNSLDFESCASMSKMSLEMALFVQISFQTSFGLKSAKSRSLQGVNNLCWRLMGGGSVADSFGRNFPICFPYVNDLSRVTSRYLNSKSCRRILPLSDT